MRVGRPCCQPAALGLSLQALSPHAMGVLWLGGLGLGSNLATLRVTCHFRGWGLWCSIIHVVRDVWWDHSLLLMGSGQGSGIVWEIAPCLLSGR